MHRNPRGLAMQGPHPVQSGFLPSATHRAAPASGPGPVRDAVQLCLQSKDRAGSLTVGKGGAILTGPGSGAGTVRWEGQCPKQTLSPHHDRKAGLTTGLPFLHLRAFTDQFPHEAGQSGRFQFSAAQAHMRGRFTFLLLRRSPHRAQPWPAHAGRRGQRLHRRYSA